uniref:Humulone synthase 1 n=1 Tax=Humulus lupulus TaxID=3486 RepID=X5D5I0_HUMLU|nr:humulone synthase 1 [Humulus lupulus]
MATATAYSFFSSPVFVRPYSKSQQYGLRDRKCKPNLGLLMVKAQSNNSYYRSQVREEDIVIVGGGIAGLATAVSLHRLGVGSLVLEQGESLRTGGIALSLYKNGWRVLDAIGVGSDIRTQFIHLQGLTIKSVDGRVLRAFNFKDDDESQEVRAVERGVLLKTLACQLPLKTIRFSSKLTNISRRHIGDDTMLELADGTRLSAKVVIGCEGIGSPIAKWMGFPKPKYVGYCSIRGLGYFPNGHSCQNKMSNINGSGVRAGWFPVSSTKIYWNISFKRDSPGPKISDPDELRKQSKELLRGWPAETLLEIIDHTLDDTIIRAPMADRWLWPGLNPLAYSGRVAVVGDAWHPMTPNLGQGASVALEDSVVLGRKLAHAVKSGSSSSVEEALESYERERWPVVFPLAIKANLLGAVLQTRNPIVGYFRDNIFTPRLNPQSMFKHTNFDVQPLGLHTKQ